MNSNNNMLDDSVVAYIQGTEASHQNSKKHTLYRVAVSFKGSSWLVTKRYKDFQDLCQQINAADPHMSLKIPAKRPILDNISSNVYNKRITLLNGLLKIICSDAEVTNKPCVRKFLRLDVSGVESRATISSDDRTEKLSDESSRTSSEVNLGGTQNIHVKPTDFEFLKMIGKGSYGKVFMARHIAEDKIYAIKVLAKSHVRKRNEVQHVMSERNVMVRIIQHPFIVKIHYSFQTADKLYFVVDFVNGGELFFHLQKEQAFSESRARFYSAEIISALGYLHANGIIYRDLKPENILLDSEGHVKLTDFGLCKEGILDNNEKTSTFCGTPEYLAPEIIQKQPYTKAVDWWCTGAVMYEMLLGTPPFYNKNYKIMHTDILTKPLQFRKLLSTNARNILLQLLQKEPEKRLGAGPNDALDVKQHPFFEEIDWDLLEAKKIPPPLVYQTRSETDLRFIDPDFINEPVPASVRRPRLLGASENVHDTAFLGFTYVNKPALAE